MKITKQDMRFQISSNKTWCISWRKNNTIHREDGPATIWSDGQEYFRIKGKAYNNRKEYWREIHENY